MRQTDDNAPITDGLLCALFEQMEDHIALYDPSGRYLGCNATSRNEPLASPSEAPPLTERCPAHDSAATLEIIREVAASGEPRTWDEDIFQQDQRLWYRVQAQPISDDKGRIEAVAKITRNITELKQAETEVQESRRQLRALSAHLDSVRDSESMRISRQIHDELGQALTCLKMDVAWLRKRLDQSQTQLLDKAVEMETFTDRTIEIVQRIASELRPIILDDLGLADAIEWLVADLEARTEIEFHTVIEPEDIELGNQKAYALYRILQEALTNVVRHSGATLVNVSLIDDGETVTLEVRDNGRGIGEEQIFQTDSIGLFQIRERAEFLEGRLEISGEVGRGTTIILNFPTPCSEA